MPSSTTVTTATTPVAGPWTAETSAVRTLPCSPPQTTDEATFTGSSRSSGRTSRQAAPMARMLWREVSASAPRMTAIATSTSGDHSVAAAGRTSSVVALVSAKDSQWIMVSRMTVRRAEPVNGDLTTMRGRSPGR